MTTHGDAPDGDPRGDRGSPPADLRWPGRLQELARILRERPGEAVRRRALAEFWEILNSALSLYLRLHARRLGRFPPEDLEDLAAQKSLDLLRKCEEGVWDPEGRAAPELVGFVSTVARNGLVDLRRRRGRLADPVAGDDEGPWEERLTVLDARGPAAESPDAAVEGSQFAAALRECAGRLQPRSRRIWLFRVFYDMPSKSIASHPDVGLKPAHVDVLLQRCREAIRACMAEAGFEPRDMPPGCFAALWEAFGRDGERGEDR